MYVRKNERTASQNSRNARFNSLDTSDDSSNEVSNNDMKPGAPPQIFGFLDYRQYLSSFLAYKLTVSRSYSQSVFTRKAGLPASSRGYLKLIIDGKRNLTPRTLRGFCEALQLDAEEAQYFENLVYFNQATRQKDKNHYLSRLSALVPQRAVEVFELNQFQHDYYSNWYNIVIRELVCLQGFSEDPAWICAQLRGRVTKAEAVEAMKALDRLGLVERGPDGRMQQKSPVVRLLGGTFRSFVHQFHLQMLEFAQEALKEDPYDTRNGSGVTLSIERRRLPELQAAIDEFRDRLVEKFGSDLAPDAVVQVCFQHFQLTPISRADSETKGA